MENERMEVFCEEFVSLLRRRKWYDIISSIYQQVRQVFIMLWLWRKTCIGQYYSI